VSDAIRTSTEHQDFPPLYPPIRRTPGLVSAQETAMSFTDAAATSPLGIRVNSESRAYTSGTTDDFVFLGYRIVNTSGVAKTGLRAGLFFDWDIDAQHFDTNVATWDAGRGMGYAYDTTDPSLPYFGILVLKGGTQTIYAAFPPGSFTDATKWEAMTGVYGTSTGPGDVSNLLSTGPFNVANGDSVAVWFALVGGHTLGELNANADQARALWNSIVAVGPSDPIPSPLSLAALEPNDAALGGDLELPGVLSAVTPGRPLVFSNLAETFAQVVTVVATEPDTATTKITGRGHPAARRRLEARRQRSGESVRMRGRGLTERPRLRSSRTRRCQRLSCRASRRYHCPGC